MTTCSPPACYVLGQHPASSWTPGHIASVAVTVLLYAVTAGIVLVILGAIGYTGFKVVLPYVNNYQLQDTCESESRLFAAHQKTEDKTKDAVWAQVQSLGIPVQQDAVKVEVIGRTARVSVDYNIVVNLFGFDVNLDFHPKGESPIF